MGAPKPKRRRCPTGKQFHLRSKPYHNLLSSSGKSLGSATDPTSALTAPPGVIASTTSLQGSCKSAGPNRLFKRGQSSQDLAPPQLDDSITCNPTQILRCNTYRTSSSLVCSHHFPDWTVRRVSSPTTPLPYLWDRSSVADGTSWLWSRPLRRCPSIIITIDIAKDPSSTEL